MRQFFDCDVVVNLRAVCPFGLKATTEDAGIDFQQIAALRFLIARRGYQPGYDAFVWTLRGGRVEGGRKFEEAVEVRDFAVLLGAAELVILDALGLRRVEAGGMRGAMLVPGEAAAQIRGIAVSADEARLATIEPDDTIVYRAGDGAPLGRISLR